VSECETPTATGALVSAIATLAGVGVVGMSTLLGKPDDFVLQMLVESVRTNAG